MVNRETLTVTREWLRVFIDIVTRIEGDPKGAHIIWGEGDPSGVVEGNVGSVFLRTDGGAGSTMYVKESDSGTTAGWAAK